MTNKKEKIVHTATELFANEGYNATSTNKIAKNAGVSEGLIFRHFRNKKGLLDHISKELDEKLTEKLMLILRIQDPKLVIRKTIELPFLVDHNEYNYWKLQYKLKWEKEYLYPIKIQPLIDKLEWAFLQLNYQDPKNEAILLRQLLDTVFLEILQNHIKSTDLFKQFLLTKYKV